MAAIASFRKTDACIDENIAERVTQALWSNPFIDPAGISIEWLLGKSSGWHGRYAARRYY